MVVTDIEMIKKLESYGEKLLQEISEKGDATRYYSSGKGSVQIHCYGAGIYCVWAIFFDGVHKGKYLYLKKDGSWIEYSPTTVEEILTSDAFFTSRGEAIAMLSEKKEEW